MRLWTARWSGSATTNGYPKAHDKGALVWADPGYPYYDDEDYDDEMPPLVQD
jgi:hypothetical protein